MENTSTALLIAAGVLIGVIILSLGVYLIQMMGGHAANIQQQIDNNRSSQFNQEFLNYNGLNNLTIQDVITVKNYALENNRENGEYIAEEDDYRASANNGYIDVFIRMLDDSRKLVFTISDENLLKRGMEKQFSCEVIINDNTGRVNRIEFTEVDT